VCLPMESWTLIRRPVVAGVSMVGRLSPRLERPLASRSPPLERGPGGGALEAP
jgi:hypothetical protein